MRKAVDITGGSPRGYKSGPWFGECVSAVSVRLLRILQHAPLFVAYFHTLISSSLHHLPLVLIFLFYADCIVAQSRPSQPLTRHEQQSHYTKSGNRAVLV